MEKKFKELMDISRLQKLMDSLYEAADIPTAIMDKDLTILTTTGWQDICVNFHRTHPEMMEKCKKSNQYINDNLYRDSCVGFRCQNGMLDYACPIIIEDEHLATLFIGQFFSKPPDEGFFRQQAWQYGLDEEAYITALRKVPIIKEERVKLIRVFLLELAQLIADMGLQSFKQLETVIFQQVLMNAIPNPIFYKDVKGIYKGCNNAFEQFIGRPKHDIIGKSVYDLSPPELAVKYQAMDDELFKNPQVQVYQYQATDGHRSKREMIFNKAPYLNFKKQVAGLVGVMVDITEQKQLELALKSSEEKYRALFDHLLNGFVYFQSVLDDNGSIIDYRILEVNAAYEKITGYSKEELLGKRISETVFSFQKATINWLELFKSVVHSGRSETIEYFSKIINKWFMISAYSPQPGYCGIIASDITEQKERIEKAQHYAYYDMLTGLPNRRLFDDRLSLAIAQSKREGGKIAVVFLDLDKFKEVNDTLGHEGGDILLKEVAQRLLACIREGDTASRLGGDEFVIILPYLKDYEEANMITIRILEQCRQSFYINDHVIKISASIGVSFFPQDGDDVTSLTRNADIAMYLCKEQGRDGICYSNKGSFLAAK